MGRINVGGQYNVKHVLFSYAEPRILSFARQDYQFPTSACTKYSGDESSFTSERQGEYVFERKRCETRTQVTVVGENFGPKLTVDAINKCNGQGLEPRDCDEPVTMMVDVVDEAGEQHQVKILDATHEEFRFELPEGVGVASLQIHKASINEELPSLAETMISDSDVALQRRRLAINQAQSSTITAKSKYRYDAPRIDQVRFGPGGDSMIAGSDGGIESAKTEGIVAAIGGEKMATYNGKDSPYRLYILGENFGEDPPPKGSEANFVNISFCDGYYPPNTLEPLATNLSARVYMNQNNPNWLRSPPSSFVWNELEINTFINQVVGQPLSAMHKEGASVLIYIGSIPSNISNSVEELDQHPYDHYKVFVDGVEQYELRKEDDSRFRYRWTVIDVHCDTEDLELRHCDERGGAMSYEIGWYINRRLKCVHDVPTMECLGAQWHPHKGHEWAQKGRPYLSCVPPPMRVGRKLIQISVAKHSVTMDAELDAQCFKDFYGKIGEFCVECWRYVSMHPTIPDATTKMMAATCDGNYDSSYGTSKPQSAAGFSIMPPSRCQSGTCQPGSDPHLDWIPKTCLAGAPKNNPDHTHPYACDDALAPGQVCHPDRAKKVDRAAEVLGVSNFVLNPNGDREICPHIMPCEPPGSCQGAGQCDLEGGYVAYYKPFLTGTRGGGRSKCHHLHYTLPEIHTLPVSDWYNVFRVNSVDANNRLDDRRQVGTMVGARNSKNQLIIRSAGGTSGAMDDDHKTDRNYLIAWKTNDPSAFRANIERRVQAQQGMSILDETFVFAVINDLQEEMYRFSELAASVDLGNVTAQWLLNHGVTVTRDGDGSYRVPRSERKEAKKQMWAFYADASNSGYIRNALAPIVSRDVDLFEFSLSNGYWLQWVRTQYLEAHIGPVWWKLVDGANINSACDMNDPENDEACSCFAPRCGQCNPETHFRLDGVCEPCPDNPWLLPMMLVLIAVSAGVSMVVLNRYAVNMTIMNIGIDYFQVLSLFSRSKTSWPPMMKFTLKYLQFFQLDLDLTGPECIARGWLTFEIKWYIKVLFPAIGGIIVALAMTQIGCKRSCTRFSRFTSIKTALSPFISAVSWSVNVFAVAELVLLGASLFGLLSTSQAMMAGLYFAPVGFLIGGAYGFYISRRTGNHATIALAGSSTVPALVAVNWALGLGGGAFCLVMGGLSAFGWSTRAPAWARVAGALFAVIGVICGGVYGWMHRKRMATFTLALNSIMLLAVSGFVLSLYVVAPVVATTTDSIFVYIILGFVLPTLATILVSAFGFYELSRLVPHEGTKSERRKKKQRELPLKTQIVSMTNAMVYFLYLSITRTAFDIFNCVDTKPATGKKYLAAQPLEECGLDGGVQQKLHYPALFVLIFYCGGFPTYVLTLFTYLRKRILADQTMRAHGRGEDPLTNKNYGVRKMFGKMYMPYQPKYYWWALVILSKKFILCLFGIIFRVYPTFQMAMSLGILFLSFVFQVTHHPFMGMMERAHIVKHEAEETLVKEILRLEKAQMLVRMNGKAYYQMVHKNRLQIDEQTRIMAKHHKGYAGYRGTGRISCCMKTKKSRKNNKCMRVIEFIAAFFQSLLAGGVYFGLAFQSVYKNKGSVSAASSEAAVIGIVHWLLFFCLIYIGAPGFLFNYNFIESCFLAISVVVNLAGVMFDTTYVLEARIQPDRAFRGEIITWTVVLLIGNSLLYFIAVFIQECISTAAKQKTRRQLIWSKVKSNSDRIRGMRQKAAGLSVPMSSKAKADIQVPATAVVPASAQAIARLNSETSKSTVGSLLAGTSAKIIPLTAATVPPASASKADPASGSASDDMMDFVLEGKVSASAAAPVISHAPAPQHPVTSSSSSASVSSSEGSDSDTASMSSSTDSDQENFDSFAMGMNDRMSETPDAHEIHESLARPAPPPLPPRSANMVLQHAESSNSSSSAESVTDSSDSD